MQTLFINIKQLLQVREANISILKGEEMKDLPFLENAYLLIENDIILDFGFMANCPSVLHKNIIDASGKIIMPTFCDSHTHIVYAGNRSGEFVDRINGLSYEEIANKGGGILNSAKKLNETPEEEIYEQSKKRLEEIINQGTGAVEIKSGYGLTLEGELKMLRVIKKLKENYPVAIKATFLGAHAFPAAYKENKDAYVKLITEEMIPAVAKENLADFVDAFLETGYFNNEQVAKIMQTANIYGLPAKIHVNQFTAINGIQTCVENNALTVDHLEIATPEDLAILKNNNTIAVALPGCSFFISIPYTPARELIENNIPFAVASDYNPGTCPTGNMHFITAISCIKMKLTPEEAINATTINGAFAMQVEKDYGSITIGKKASFIITKPLQNFHEIVYNYATNFIEDIWLNGKKIIY
jgi:imidazolonepropionase